MNQTFQLLLPRLRKALSQLPYLPWFVEGGFEQGPRVRIVLAMWPTARHEMRSKFGAPGRHACYHEGLVGP